MITSETQTSPSLDSSTTTPSSTQTQAVEAEFDQLLENAKALMALSGELKKRKPSSLENDAGLGLTLESEQSSVPASPTPSSTTHDSMKKYRCEIPEPSKPMFVKQIPDLSSLEPNENNEFICPEPSCLKAFSCKSDVKYHFVSHSNAR